MFRIFYLLSALTSLGAGLALAWHYPLGWQVPSLFVLLWTVLSYRQPAANLWLVPMLLPLIGLYPWTGWLTFEEFDLLVLAVVAGGYARLALEKHSPLPVSRWMQAAVFLMLFSVLVSACRGFSDAGGFVFSWFQGYEGPMNSVRIGKSFLWALALVPILAWLEQRNSAGTARLLALGMAGAGLTAGLVALWERLAYTGLLNFTTDYRTTGPFWEMHVGGAALDGWLMLTFPFVCWAVISAKGGLKKGLALVALAIVGYAALTTFSRGVFLGLLVSAGLLAWLLRHRSGSQLTLPKGAWRASGQILALMLSGGLLVAAFVSGGYRGLLAMFGAVTLALLAPKLSGRFSRSRVFIGLMLGLLAGLGLSALSDFLPKGPYLVYAALWVGAFVCLHPLMAKRFRQRPFTGFVAVVALVVSAANLAGHWAGLVVPPVYTAASLVLLVLFLWGVLSKVPSWPNDIRWQGRLLVQTVALCSVAVVFAGGAYMGERFSTVGKDWQGRLAHWSDSIAILSGSDDLFFGKGLGRYPANYYFADRNGIFPGTFRLEQEGGERMLSLVGASHPMSPGDILRISQRLPRSEQGPFIVDLLVRARTDVSIYAEVCDKHLLYPAACVAGEGAGKAAPGRWQRMSIRLQPALLPESALPPRFRVFSIGIGNQSGRADIDEIGLSSLDGRNLLKNGDFSAETARWFFSSDRDHLPWHAKNLLVNILFDQGMLGVGAFLLLAVLAVWRAGNGCRRNDEWAPFCLAALAGFWVTGIFDSLTDVPRLAFLYYLLLMFTMIHRFVSLDQKSRRTRVRVSS